jgi:hypothetical protein
MTGRGLRQVGAFVGIATALTVPSGAAAQLLPPAQADEPPPKPPPVLSPRSSGTLWFDLSLQNTLLRVEGPGGHRTTEGGLASLELAWTTNIRSFELSGLLAGAIGGGGGSGGGGVEGEFRLDDLIGVRGYLGEQHGPFLRIGPTVRVLAYPTFSFHYLGGVGEVGYQFIDKHFGFELGALGGGATSTVTPAARPASMLGAFASMTGRQGVLRLEWEHFGPPGTSPFDYVASSGCVVLHQFVPLCLTQWSLVSGGGADHATYVGLSVGLGGGFTGTTREGERAPEPAR